MELTEEKRFVKTSIFMLSDTHGMTLDERIPDGPVADVCVHAGDLTEESKLEEFHSAIALLRRIDAPLKLVIAGNHDFTLDTPSFKQKIREIKPRLEPTLVKKFYGDYEEARQLLLNAKEEHGIHLLNEGTHEFMLPNGGKLRVYANPYTPSLGDWGFQYRPDDGRNFAIEDGTNIVVTHGPPRGILDRTNNRERAGCPDLFAAVAKAKPQIHCFGHIHEGWGAKVVAWRSKLSEKPSFLTDIDNSASSIVEQLTTLHETKFDSLEDADAKRKKLENYKLHKYCTASVRARDEGDIGRTLFVNASIKGDSSSDVDLQLPWLVDVMLSREPDPVDSSAATPSYSKDISAAASCGDSSPEEGVQEEQKKLITESTSAKSCRRKLPSERTRYTEKTAWEKRPLEVDHQAESGSQPKTRRQLPKNR
ncbi:hypothetical protein LMH87_010045 [Akanthomyces muscarius]|uniref:Calcineurin-like phosphoesterase domain-containing protein n=1 Tax=Akanthomyces muscarius TaxID=2231603 RepID=A0A9W8QE64_AKAMU|nr:hypothetical protein LMH87_010045 [Akanthomyces muscarius]KAJ4153562.1 hypothetical protein LMH87_010045 [Akanthomyces muscarius]